MRPSHRTGHSEAVFEPPYSKGILKSFKRGYRAWVMFLIKTEFEGQSRWLFHSKVTMPVLIVVMLVAHFALQILSSQFYASEWEIGAAILYVVSGSILLLVAAEFFRRAINEHTQSDLFQGIALCMLSVTILFVGLGVGGLFGETNQTNVNLGVYLLTLGMGLSGLFFLFAPRVGKLHSGPHIVMIALVGLIVFLVGLYQLQHDLPSLYLENGLPSLWRQQLLTVVQVIFVLASVRYAMQSGGKTTQSAQWHIIGVGILALVTTDFLLSHVPGDAYSWSGRFFTLLAAGAFIQSLWWSQKGE